MNVSAAAPGDTNSGFALAAVFLDRDGVLNCKAPEGSYISSWDEFQVLPGVAQAILLLNRAGLPVFVVLNQRGIALGLYSAFQVDSIHESFQQLLAASGALSTASSFALTTQAAATAGSLFPASLSRPRPGFRVSRLLNAL